MIAIAWSALLLDEVERALSGRSGNRRLKLAPDVGVHLAVFVEPYLGLILDGKKTVESRFGVQRCAPHGRVAPQDIVLLKRVSGPVVAICEVRETWFFDLTKVGIDTVRDQFSGPLCADDPAFWARRAHSTLATLMRIERVTPIDPIRVAKRDRRGWVMLRARASHPSVNGT